MELLPIIHIHPGRSRTFTYDYDNMPVTIAKNNQATINIYDAFGTRIQKIVPGPMTTTYIGQYYDCENLQCTKYLFAGTKRIANIKGSETYYYHTDHLDSSNIVTDSSGDSVEDIFYYPYGEMKYHTGSVNLRHKYTGKEWDAETGLYYYGARYYDPKLAKFISADTIVPLPFHPISLNRYAFTYNNPIILKDLDGHWPEVWDKAKKNYNKLYPHEKAFVHKHPYAAYRIGSYSKGSNTVPTVAFRFASMGYRKETLSILSSETGKNTGGINAMRHVLVSAFMAADWGKDIAKEAADSHEANIAVDMSRTEFEEMKDADMAADQRNNEIGREIGSSSSGKSRLDITEEVVEKYRNEGYWNAYKTEKGYELKQIKLENKQYEGFKKALINKDNNARWKK